MSRQSKNSLFATGALLGLASLPMTWLTVPVEAAKMGGAVGPFLSMIGRSDYSLTGLSGSVTLLAPIPIWFLLAISIGLNLLGLARESSFFAAPRHVVSLVACGTLLLMVVPVLLHVGGGQISLGFGWIVGVASVVCALVGALAPGARRPDEADRSAGF